MCSYESKVGSFNDYREANGCADELAEHEGPSRTPIIFFHHLSNFVPYQADLATLNHLFFIFGYFKRYKSYLIHILPIFEKIEWF